MTAPFRDMAFDAIASSYDDLPNASEEVEVTLPGEVCLAIAGASKVMMEAEAKESPAGALAWGAITAELAESVQGIKNGKVNVRLPRCIFAFLSDQIGRLDSGNWDPGVTKALDTFRSASTGKSKPWWKFW